MQATLASMRFLIKFNPFMYNFYVHTTRFLRYVWPFFNIKHEKLKAFLGERSSPENMLQIYRKTPMPKCDFDTLHFPIDVLL